MPGVPPICSTRGVPLRTPHPRTPVNATLENVARAAIGDATDKILWKKNRIKVAFLKKKESLLKDWNLDASEVLEWANRWSSRANSRIPTFELCLEEEKADIIVELNRDGRNESRIGRVDSTDGESTMWLDLSHDNHGYCEHLVVHEFGHALGLKHEHQRSDFWRKVEPYMKTFLIEADMEERFKDYKEEFDPTSSTDYDPDSVMHYWFKREWLIEDYNSSKKIQQQRDLYAISKSEKEALLGVLHRDYCHGFVKEPSEYDLKFLNDLYTYGRYMPYQGCSSVTITHRTSYIYEDYTHGPLLEPRKAMECINRLRDQHENLHKRLRKFLGQKDDQIMDGIRFVLASLHCENPQYRMVLDELKSEASVNGYFQVLMTSSPYLDFNGLLDELIRKYGDQELNEDAELYRNDLLIFLGHTTIKQAANPKQPWWCAQHDNIPQKFSKVKMHVLEDPDTFRLIHLISCRMRFTSEIGLHHLLFILLGIKELNSFGVSWLFPSVMTPVLTDAIRSRRIGIFQTYKVSSLSIMTEQILYSGIPSAFKLPSNLPTLHTAGHSRAAGKSIQGSSFSLEDKSKIEQEIQEKLMMPNNLPLCKQVSVKSYYPATCDSGYSSNKSSQKDRGFSSEPIGEKLVKDVPGVGHKLAEKLSEKGCHTARHLLGMYLIKSEEEFKTWLETEGGANTKEQRNCFSSLKDWCATFL